MGLLRMKNMQFFGYHGITAAEKELAKRYTVDVEIKYDTATPAKYDKLDNPVVDYEKVYWEIEQFFRSNRFHLTETVAERLADMLFASHPMAEKLVVHVRKNHPPFPGFLELVEVEVERKR